MNKSELIVITMAEAKAGGLFDKPVKVGNSWWWLQESPMFKMGQSHPSFTTLVMAIPAAGPHG
jgi:hypothetical protein